jgi:D-lactate dehydrogenase (cytochrome)
MAQATLTTTPLRKQVASIVGPDHVTDDPGACELATSDVFEASERARAELVVSPRTTEETSAVVRLLSQNRLPALARGAGLSYTGSFAIERPTAVIDTRRMIDMEVNAADRYAVVGAGASWAHVAEALRPAGMTPAQVSPISGAFATVGGLASQGIPAGLDGILGLVVVLADGSVARTGAPSHFYRYAGPDVSGLFLGDCGAFGIKTEVVVRIAPEPPVAFASFGFDDADQLLESLVACMGECIVTRAFAMDRLKSQDARKVGLGEAVQTAAAVIGRSRTLAQSAREAAKLLRFAAGASEEKPWSLHLTMESPTQAGADAQRERAGRICGKQGTQIDDVFPRALRAKPYSVRGFVGPAGERWVPVHGIFAFSRVRAAMRDLRSCVADCAGKMQELGVHASWLISSAGAHVVIEPMLYWQDQLDAFHMQYLSPRNRERFGGFPPNTAAREFVRAIRESLRDVMDKHGAVHSQIGRFYSLNGGGMPENLLQRLKTVLDPDSIFNPGVLGLG